MEDPVPLLISHDKDIHILLVEDDDSYAGLVYRWCERIFPCYIHRVVSLKGAIDAAVTLSDISLIIFDVKLVDNTSLWGIIPVLQVFPDVPLLVLTSGFPEWHDDALYLGAKAFALKYNTNEETFRTLLLTILA